MKKKTKLTPAQEFILGLLPASGGVILSRAEAAGFVVVLRSLNTLVQRGLAREDDGYFDITESGEAALAQ